MRRIDPGDTARLVAAAVPSLAVRHGRGRRRRCRRRRRPERLGRLPRWPSSRPRSSPGRGARSSPRSRRSSSTTSCSSCRSTRSPSPIPGEWLNLVLLLFIGIVVGQLVALQRSRTEVARGPRARGAGAVPGQPRARDARVHAGGAAGDRAASCGRRPRWSGSGSPSDRTTRGSESRPTRIPTARPALPGLHSRPPADARTTTPARWSRVHQPRSRAAAAGPAGARPTGSGSRPAAGRSARSGRCATRGRGEPDRTETRLLSAAADQIGQALAQDRLAAEAQAAEIARQSDALKSALLQSVSHDLRTPLATIRAAAGTLRPGQWPERRGPAGERRRDRPRGRVPQPARDEPARPEPDRGRRPARRTRRVRARRPRRPDRRPAAAAAGRPAARRSSSAAPPVDVDPVLPRRGPDERARERDQVRAGRDARSAIVARDARRRAARPADGRGRRARASPTQALPRLFEKFYRVPGAAGGSRSGHRDRPGGRPRARRGDGRPVGGAPQRARRARDRHRPPGRRPAPATAAAEAAA